MDIKEKTRQALEDGKIVGDGHTIYKPSFYEPHFTLDELKEANLLERYESDFSSGKTTIYDNDGKPMDYVYGVYNLTFLYWLANQLNVTGYRECFGRGSQAQVLVDAIREALS
jgi:hypothetical protein